MFILIQRRRGFLWPLGLLMAEPSLQPPEDTSRKIGSLRLFWCSEVHDVFGMGWRRPVHDRLSLPSDSGLAAGAR